jgi:hypothetical protein
VAAVEQNRIAVLKLSNAFFSAKNRSALGGAGCGVVFPGPERAFFRLNRPEKAKSFKLPVKTARFTRRHQCQAHLRRVLQVHPKSHLQNWPGDAGVAQGYKTELNILV